jgi:6-phosphogluconolactonase
MKTIIDTNEQRLAAVAGQALIDEANRILTQKDTCLLGIVGGSSVVNIFKWLSQTEDMPWDKIHIFMVDERLVPLDDEQSNYRLARESFLDTLLSTGLITTEQLHPFVYDPDASDMGIEQYTQELTSYGDHFDIVILSSGEDAHCAALFAHHHSIDDQSDYFVTMQDALKPPNDRMSSSRSLLERSEVAFALFIGDRKKDAYRSFSKQDCAIEQCPIALVKQIDHAYIITNISDT